MNASSIEITDNEYCIKLNKETFNLSLVHQLIKRIQAEELFFSRQKFQEDDDIISHRTNTEDLENFDYLGDK